MVTLGAMDIMGAEWETLVSSDVVIAALVLLSASCVMALIWIHRFSPWTAAKRVVAQQFDVAPRYLVDDFLALAEERGNDRQFLAELTKIRTTYGHQGLKFGHLMWIDMKLAGRIDSDAEAPPFDKK